MWFPASQTKITHTAMAGLDDPALVEELASHGPTKESEAPKESRKRAHDLLGLDIENNEASETSNIDRKIKNPRKEYHSFNDYRDQLFRTLQFIRFSHMKLSNQNGVL